MALINIVQSAALRTLANKPASAASSTDAKVLQLVEYVNEAGQELASRNSWQVLTNEASYQTPGVTGGITGFGAITGGSGYAAGFTNSFTFVPLTGGTGTGAFATVTVTAGVVTGVSINLDQPGSGYLVGDSLSATAASLGGSGSGFSVLVSNTGLVGEMVQGLITALAGPDFNFIVNDTMWNRTQRRPVFGPKSPAEWQQLKAQFMQGPWIQYRLRGNEVIMMPTPSPGFAIYFEWCSKYWCQSSTGTGQTSMMIDSDVGILDERLIMLSAIWRFKKAQRMEYMEDFNVAEDAINDAISRDGSKQRMNLAGAQTDIYPGVVVPAGAWPIAGNPNGA